MLASRHRLLRHGKWIKYRKLANDCTALRVGKYIAHGVCDFPRLLFHLRFSVFGRQIWDVVVVEQLVALALAGRDEVGVRLHVALPQPCSKLEAERRRRPSTPSASSLMCQKEAHHRAACVRAGWICE